MKSTTLKFLLKKTGDTDYLAKVHRPLMGDTETIKFTNDLTNNKLCFSCNGEQITYQK